MYFNYKSEDKISHIKNWSKIAVMQGRGKNPSVAHRAQIPVGKLRTVL